MKNKEWKKEGDKNKFGLHAREWYFHPQYETFFFNLGVR
jgi:hypothetical protein